MSNANFISDAEQAEHRNLGKGVGAKRVISYVDNGDGTYNDQQSENLANQVYVVGDYVYDGSAVTGSSQSAAVWQISRFDKVNLTTVWADGNTFFDNIMDNYASLTYL